MKLLGTVGSAETREGLLGSATLVRQLPVASTHNWSCSPFESTYQVGNPVAGSTVPTWVTRLTCHVATVRSDTLPARSTARSANVVSLLTVMGLPSYLVPLSLPSVPSGSAGVPL